jgi:hypothetical protein
MDDVIVRQTILRQYRAGMAMLGQAVELCPEELWLSSAYKNRFWHIRLSFHVLCALLRSAVRS